MIITIPKDGRSYGAVTKYLDEYPPVDPDSCELLGPTALVVQGLMGVIVILSLVYKRHREKPKRPWRIWLFDVSKQIVGQMFVHGVNLLMSNRVAHRKSTNACVAYILNILLDTTLGVGILYLFLYLLTYLLMEKLGLKGFESGQYGSPPSVFYWLRQASVYVLSLATMKLTVLFLFVLFPFLFDIGEWLLGWTWTGKGDALQVIFTMGIFPIIMNVLQFWLIDSIVKASGVVALPSDSSRNSFDDLAREPLFDTPSDDEDDSSINVQPRHDIENPPPQQSQPATEHSRTILPQPPENKTIAHSSSDTSEPRDIPVIHSYPPSVASTSTTRSASPPFVKPQHLPKQFKRRPPPPPLDLESPSHPAANIPAAVREVEKQDLADDASREWDNSWGDSDDWANRDEEDDWTEQRIAQKIYDRDDQNRAVLPVGA